MAVTTEEMVRRVRACGQSIVDNAESIAGDYRGQTEIEIHVTIPVSDYPRIRTRTEFLPEEILDTGLNTVSDFYKF